jgi:HD domain-containing protein
VRSQPRTLVAVIRRPCPRAVAFGGGLRRPDLTAEMDEMRKHPLMGSEILAGSDAELLQVGGLIALTHHERWDGTGCPYRLSGTAIPVAPHRGFGRRVRCADR